MHFYILLSFFLSSAACACHSAGSVDGGLCDPVSGHCLCKQNVEGKHCDRCKIGSYGLSQEDPRGCQSKGSSSASY